MTLEQFFDSLAETAVQWHLESGGELRAVWPDVDAGVVVLCPVQVVCRTRTGRLTTVGGAGRELGLRLEDRRSLASAADNVLREQAVLEVRKRLLAAVGLEHDACSEPPCGPSYRMCRRHAAEHDAEVERRARTGVVAEVQEALAEAQGPDARLAYLRKREGEEAWS